MGGGGGGNTHPVAYPTIKGPSAASKDGINILSSSIPQSFRSFQSFLSFQSVRRNQVERVLNIGPDGGGWTRVMYRHFSHVKVVNLSKSMPGIFAFAPLLAPDIPAGSIAQAM